MVEHDNIKSKKNEVKGSKRLYFCWAKLAMGEPVALKYFIHNGQIFRDGWTSISINSSPPNMGVYRQSGNDIHDGHEKIIWWRPPETRMEPRKQNHLFIRTFFVKLNNCVYVCVLACTLQDDTYMTTYTYCNYSCKCKNTKKWDAYLFCMPDVSLTFHRRLKTLGRTIIITNYNAAPTTVGWKFQDMLKFVVWWIILCYVLGTLWMGN